MFTRFLAVEGCVYVVCLFVEYASRHHVQMGLWWVGSESGGPVSTFLIGRSYYNVWELSDYFCMETWIQIYTILYRILWDWFYCIPRFLLRSVYIIFVNDSEVRPKYCAKQTLHCSWFMMFEDSHMTHIWTKYSFKLCRLSWPVSMYEIFPGCWVMVHGIHVHSLLLVQDIQQKLNFDYRLAIKEITQLLDRSL